MQNLACAQKTRTLFAYFLFWFGFLKKGVHLVGMFLIFCCCCCSWCSVLVTLYFVMLDFPFQFFPQSIVAYFPFYPRHYLAQLGLPFLISSRAFLSCTLLLSYSCLCHFPFGLCSQFLASRCLLLSSDLLSRFWPLLPSRVCLWLTSPSPLRLHFLVRG